MRPRSVPFHAVAFLIATLALAAPGLAQDGEAQADVLEEVTQGALRVVTAEGKIVECPLERTEVEAEISGMIAHVRVTQIFHNPYEKRIEAVYVFPLSNTAAVHAMTMIVGEKRIVGEIRKRAEAKEIYEKAVREGKTAALLSQERPNIFTQSVGNIPPGERVKVEIACVDVLAFDQGAYTFHFPMVVGPRYIPGAPLSATPPLDEELKGKTLNGNDGARPQSPDGPTAPPSGTGTFPDTDRVPDASRITPPTLKRGFRPGHDIRLRVTLDAGVPLASLSADTHETSIERRGSSCATVTLSERDSIPNKDFELRYGTMGASPTAALLAHKPAEGDGAFLLTLQPMRPKEAPAAPPREALFSPHPSPSSESASSRSTEPWLQPA
jgi:Ca-activated chloride channel family protein